MIKKVIRLSSPFFIFILQAFYKREYLCDKYFKNTLMGYRWAFRSIFIKNILRLSRPYPFPTALTCNISNPNNIIFDYDDLHNFQSEGTYFQNFSASIYIGKGSFIAKNVGIITANHDFNDLTKHLPGKDVVIGERCWIGMNAVILPGVHLANGTIVGAGSIVTKSVLEENVVIAGNPAVKISSY
ncbi:acyltransferase [Avibacterium volantium]|uniref:Maltose O-acetyltransferase n=1 Tax=Avibacterium volantium TaxID=762 RepID=A0A3S4H079_AVIVO|nr:acyltransferase [Avibacterium volantium]VEB24922.1 Maltose O-acetyltransferase [Avibacterium volantium]